MPNHITIQSRSLSLPCAFPPLEAAAGLDGARLIGRGPPGPLTVLRGSFELVAWAGCPTGGSYATSCAACSYVGGASSTPASAERFTGALGGTIGRMTCWAGRGRGFVVTGTLTLFELERAGARPLLAGISPVRVVIPVC